MTSPNFNKKAFLYKTTNLINGKVYIGVRTYKNSVNDDKYLGSGKAIEHAIKMYGRENFKREVLLVSTAEYCYEVEKQWVNQEWVDSTDNYNICIGGWGGARGPEAIKSQAEKHKKIWQELPEEKKEERKRFLDSIRPSPDQIVRRGRDTKKWSGWWLTPLASFMDVRAAADFYGLDNKTVRSRCKTSNTSPIMKPKMSGLQKQDKGKTWKELGWGFMNVR